MSMHPHNKGSRRGKRTARRDRAALRIRPGDPLCEAKIQNESATGVAFVMTRQAPALGSTVRVFLRRIPHGRRAEVVRIEHTPPGGTLVGCTWVGTS